MKLTWFFVVAMLLESLLVLGTELNENIPEKDAEESQNYGQEIQQAFGYRAPAVCNAQNNEKGIDFCIRRCCGNSVKCSKYLFDPDAGKGGTCWCKVGETSKSGKDFQCKASTVCARLESGNSHSGKTCTPGYFQQDNGTNNCRTVKAGGTDCPKKD